MQPLRNYFGGMGNRLFQLSYIYAQCREGNIPDIYLQDFKYFEKYKDEIKAMFSIGAYAPKDLVALHIRKGDYNDNNFYVDLTKTDYYDKAIALFPGKKFLVFCADRQPISNDTNDREWVKNWLDVKGVEYEIYDGKDEIDDFNAMASCRGMIIANSTFSTWAAYLNPNEGLIVAPEKYYADGVERTVRPKNNNWLFI